MLQLKYYEIEEFEGGKRARILQDYEGSSSSPQHVIKSMFWETRDLCACVSQKLKKVYIKGFMGKELEMGFVKYLITKATMMESIAICFDDDCSRNGATDAMCLLSLEKASPNLCITLKTVNEYMANGGGSFERSASSMELH